MSKKTNAASKPNPALKPLDVLVGAWKTTGTHPYFPDTTLQGRVTFEWVEGGAFLSMVSTIDQPEFPDTIAILGSDDAAQEIYLLTFDERGISRKYNFSLQGNTWKWWRDTPEFSQRFTVTIQDGGRTMVSKGEMSKNGEAWEGDLNLTYTRQE